MLARPVSAVCVDKNWFPTKLCMAAASQLSGSVRTHGVAWLLDPHGDAALREHRPSLPPTAGTNSHSSFGSLSTPVLQQPPT